MTAHPTSTGIERRRVVYSGRVQGVGFRATTLQISRQYSVQGYVRNLPDGTVEVVVEGENRAIDAFLGSVSQTMRTWIHDRQFEVASPTGEFSTFSIQV